MEDIVENVAKGVKRVTIVWNSSCLEELLRAQRLAEDEMQLKRDQLRFDREVFLDKQNAEKLTKQLRIIIAVIKDALAHSSAIRLIHDN